MLSGSQSDGLSVSGVPPAEAVAAVEAEAAGQMAEATPTRPVRPMLTCPGISPRLCFSTPPIRPTNKLDSPPQPRLLMNFDLARALANRTLLISTVNDPSREWTATRKLR